MLWGEKGQMQNPNLCKKKHFSVLTDTVVCILIEQFTSEAANVLKATHTTPVKHYVDDLTFTLTAVDSSNCKVHVSFIARNSNATT